jgi:hypothetical protein
MVDGDSAPFWDAAKEGRLVLQRCTKCDGLQHYPRSLCVSCHSDRLEFVEASGRGIVHSYTVVHRSPDPERFVAPYVVALIRLEEGPMLMSNVVDIEPDSVRCELPVEVGWRDLDDGNCLPVFRPTERT